MLRRLVGEDLPQSPPNHLYMPLQKSLRVAAQLLHKGPGYTPEPSFTLYVLPANEGIFRVGDSGFEPLASSASRKRSPPELIALIPQGPASLPRGGTRNRTGVQGFADPCLTTRPCRQLADTFGPGVRAEDGIRTRDPHHGKVMLYQLSYFRLLARII